MREVAAGLPSYKRVKSAGRLGVESVVESYGRVFVCREEENTISVDLADSWRRLSGGW